MLDAYGTQRHINVDSDTLSYTVRGLLNFATYTFQVVAVTKYGEGVHSPVLRASKFLIRYLYPPKRTLFVFSRGPVRIIISY
jgi:hypothetical protein